MAWCISLESWHLSAIQWMFYKQRYSELKPCLDGYNINISVSLAAIYCISVTEVICHLWLQIPCLNQQKQGNENLILDHCEN